MRDNNNQLLLTSISLGVHTYICLYFYLYEDIHRCNTFFDPVP